MNLIEDAIRSLGLTETPVCVHASLRSFGDPMPGGADAIVEAFLNHDCTILVPTFSWAAYSVPPPPHVRPARNGCDYSAYDEGPTARNAYTPESNEIDDNMGVLPAAVLARPGRVRGGHPLSSFTATGPRAEQMVRDQAPLRVYAPLEALAAMNGDVVLMGVGLDSMTLLHLAEQRAGRTLFRRWASVPEGTIAVEAGGCSGGFPRLESVIGSLSRERLVARSRWRVFPAAATLEAAARAITADSTITKCDDPHCVRCHDALLGGPIL